MLEGYLCNLINYDQKDWYQLLPLAEHTYNNSTTNTHGMSPFYANYGFHPQSGRRNAKLKTLEQGNTRTGCRQPTNTPGKR